MIICCHEMLMLRHADSAATAFLLDTQYCCRYAAFDAAYCLALRFC